MLATLRHHGCLSTIRKPPLLDANGAIAIAGGMLGVSVMAVQSTMVVYGPLAAYGAADGGMTMAKPKRAALYVRVSTDAQTVENQIAELREDAERRGRQVVEIYRDVGISGAKGRDQRSGLDAMLKDASRRKFDVVMAWPIDRIGRSLIGLAYHPGSRIRQG